MHLLNTETFEVKEFYTDIPLYAILSHTWEKEEVTFQDIQNLNVAKTKASWSKVERACQHARKYTFEWIWIDSCCIDKSSSAELSEALNSMYQYYTDAEVCYVYLCDVSSQENPRDARSRFRSSRWFTRGWTLQELIAPMYAVFLDTEWNEIGTRWSLRDALSAITTIPVEVFEGRDIDEFSIAQRMSWAAYRETTRPEDQAYCLMGIFNVNMPPIYGEGGAKAFIRLQQEIIKISDDRSIFVWMSEPISTGPEALSLFLPHSRVPADSEVRGLLARSPREFWASGQVIMSNAELIGDKSSFSFENNGLRIHLPLVLDENAQNGDPIFLASLHCKRQGVANDTYLSICLRKIGEQQYVRCHSNKVVVTSLQMKDFDFKEVVVKENSLPRRVRRKHGVVDFDSSRTVHFELSSSAQGLFVLNQNRFATFPLFFHSVNFTNGVQYESPNEEQEFSCMLGVDRCKNKAVVEAISIGSYRPRWVCHFPHRGLPADRVQFRLKSGLLHIRLHMGSKQKRVEIDYKHTTECNNYQNTLLRPPGWSCIVPSVIPTPRWMAPASLESVVPPSFFDRMTMESNRGYLYIACDANVPHLLTYRWEESKRCYVAVGFRESGEAWTDIFFPEQEIADSDESDYRDIRKSYLDSGTWRTNQASASAELKLDSLSGEYLLTATIQDTQNITLQLGSHSLLLEVKRVPPGRGSSRESYRLPFTDFIPLTPIAEEDDED